MRILIIGDLGGQAGAASSIAKDRGADIILSSSIESALTLLRGGKAIEMVLMDVREPIRELISQLQTEHIHVPVIACGIHSDARTAANAIKAGAEEYLPLPPDAELISAIFESISHRDFTLIGDAEPMRKMLALARQVAPSEASILITGESGTGKEMIARYIHSHSPRNNEKLICVNCAAIPDNLLESELFGHEKGAFTGAIARRIGKFEEANHSTLLLDEISEMDLRLQAKLLRAIQEKEIDRVGSSQPIKLDIRILATSNRNLQEEVAKGTFREDLYYRLNIITLEQPPLRHRKSDIPALAEHFIKKYVKLNQLGTKTISKDARDKLAKYRWPGNVRELENTLHRAVLIAPGSTIEPEHILLPNDPSAKESDTSDDSTAASASPGLIGRSVESVEKELILGTIAHCDGNRTHAATILGISIRTLRNKLKQYEEAV